MQSKMLISSLCFVLFGFNRFGRAENQQPVNYADCVHYSVVASNGMKLGFFINSTNKLATATVDQPTLVCFGHIPTSASVVYMPKDEYLASVRLTDANNNEVKRTSSAKSFSRKPNLNWNEKFVRHQHGQVEPWSILQEDWSMPLSLPSADKLFHITNSGDYHLTIDMQMFLRVGTNIQLVSFPSLKIPMTKP